MIVKKAKVHKGVITYNANLTELEYLKLLGFTKQNRSEAVDAFLSKLVFYGKTLNMPGKIFELQFKNLDFRPDENMLLINFDIISGYGCVFYSVFEYGTMFSLRKEDLL